MFTISTQSTQHTPTLSKKELSDKQNSLTDQIIKIERTLDNYESRYKVSENKFLNERQIYKKLKIICNDVGGNSLIRFKNNTFRKQPSSNFLKQFLFGSRYKLELKAAADKIEPSKNSVTAIEGMMYYLQKWEESLQQCDSLIKKMGIEEDALDKVRNERKPITKQLEEIKSQEVEAQKIAEKRKKDCRNFALIFQSNAGHRAINAQARYLYGSSTRSASLDYSDITTEYELAHGKDIFNKGNKHYKFDLKFNAKRLTTLVTTAANNWYTPTSTNTTTYRGQGMTSRGIQTLIEHFNADKNHDNKTVYQPGQFFSTSSRLAIAEDFAQRSLDKVKVMFTVMGNSGDGIYVSNGFDFKDTDSEMLYSPFANFTVTDLTRNSAKNMYHVTLKEVPSQEGAKLLPY